MPDFSFASLSDPGFLCELDRPPVKVRAMYDAVVTMVNEDCDINSIKVSDITFKAGIGKGTAYQYFTSKEELVVKALLYSIYSQIISVKDAVAEVDEFKNKFMYLLDYIHDNRQNIKTYLALVRIISGSVDISSVYRTEYGKIKDPRKEYFENLIKWFLAFADEENLLKEERFEFRSAALMAHIIEFITFIYSANENLYEEVKEFVYRGFINELN
ncbi:MAG: TetR/AcrR family transcriptional regulator [Lachnospiraceae bacterium]|nr:TetR/AcrR family transcriptional regulator [Lachnospiraceae bacterium]